MAHANGDVSMTDYSMYSRIDDTVVIIAPERVYIHPTARIDAFVKIEGGEGVYIGEHVHIAAHASINVGGGITVMRGHCGVSAGVRVVSGMPVLKYKYISAADPESFHRVDRRRTVIESYAVAFANAVIGPGVTLGVGAVLGACSFAHDDIPDWQIWGGVPARFIKRREWEHDQLLFEMAAVA